jgi:chromosomal replication initiation ATPase DnaA
VNRIRAGTTKTGLAYVTAIDFPDQVRHLIDDPSPVQRAQTAVLLVDQLDRFKDLIDELEAVVRIFLDHKHYVVLASKVHPGRLPHLSQGFRDLIDAGQVVQIVPRGAESQIETIRRQVRDETDAQLAKKQRMRPRTSRRCARNSKPNASRKRTSAANSPKRAKPRSPRKKNLNNIAAPN